MFAKLYSLPLCAILLWLPVYTLVAQTNLSADLPMEFDGNDNSVVAKQNAIFVHQELSVTADEIRYSKNDEIATARGNVRMNYRGMRIVAGEATYNVKTGDFATQAFRMGYFPYMISGKSLVGDKEKIVARHATIYANQNKGASPNVYVRKLTLHPGDEAAKVKLQAALARVGIVPVLPIPYAAAKVNYDRDLSLRVGAGSGDTYGNYLRTESLYPTSENMRLGANLDYYSKRGWLVGPKADWSSDDIQASLSAGYIADRGNRGNDTRNQPISKDRGFIGLRYQQDAHPLQITQQVQYWSDSEILRDYRPDSYDDEQGPDTFTEVVYPGDGVYLSAFARYDINNFEAVPQKTPEVRYDKLYAPIGDTGAYYSLYNSVAHIDQDPYSYNRYDGILGVRRPIRMNSMWQLTPVAGGRYTYYDTTTSGNSSVDRLLGEVGLDSQWSYNSVWEYKNPMWEIDGLKHLVQPIVQYRYLPGATKGSGQIPTIEGNVFDTNLRTLDFLYQADIDQPDSRNLIRLGLKQSLQTRNKSAGGFPSRDLATFDIYQDYNFSSSDGRQNIDDFYILSEVTPVVWISAGALVRLNWDEMTWKENRFFVTLRDGDYRSLTISARYLQDNINQYGAFFTQKLTDRISFFSDLDYDVRIHGFSDAFVGLEQRLRSGWNVQYGFSRKDNDARDSRSQFIVKFRWYNF